MKNRIKILVIYWFVGWLVLLLGRMALMVFHLNFSEGATLLRFIPLTIYNIIRFDFQVLAYISVLPSLLMIVHSFLPNGVWINKFCRWYYAIAYSLVAIVTTFDLGFYKNFGEHFNVTAFDFFNEGPLSLIRVIWEEHPVILYTLVVVVVFFAVFKLPIANIGQDLTKKTTMLWWVAWIISIVILMRGSVTEFPLQIEDLYVSPSKTLNDCVPNALYSLKKALKEKKTAFKTKSEDGLLAEYGFESEDEAWNIFSQGRTSPFDSLSEEVVQKRDSAQKPNIVIMISESWSGWLCDYALGNHTEELLCGMQRHLEEDLFYKNFVSVENGTIATIERLALCTPYPRIANSKYRYCHFDSSIANPFNDSGYLTTFISGIDQGWQNVGELLKNQGFKRIISKYELLAEHSDYEYNSIGVYDHHLMNSLLEELNTRSEIPQMFFVVTTTNHPPFVYPQSVSLPQISDSLYNEPYFANSRDVEEKYIKGFQYANLSMSDFLDRLKSSPAGDNTIVVITGDHNVRTALAYSDDGIHVPTEWKTRVPLYIYLPERYRNSDDGKYPHNTQVYGCHYDIMPTIAPFAFDSGVEFFSMGQNLFSTTLNEGNTYGSNVTGVICAPEYTATAQRKSEARDLLLHLYFQRFMFSPSHSNP